MVTLKNSTNKVQRFGGRSIPGLALSEQWLQDMNLKIGDSLKILKVKDRIILEKYDTNGT